MTDSMKFGPEWLRNMSADSVSSVNNVSNNSNTVNAYGGTSHSVGSGNNYHNNSNINLPTTNSTSSMLTLTYSSNLMHHGLSGSSGIHASASLSANQHTPQKNSFPEFRYGREEMLSLFDKHCCLPDILPAYKKIFVEKVQYPLALVPSTDEEMIQGPSIPTQRTSWPQRSPVGFSSSTRGSGRGGSVDRGRMRGKSIYHNIYQRPIGMFEDDTRSGSLKSERNWSERNGSSGDAHLNSGGSLAGGGVSSSSGGNDWNGTLTTSPRKEYSSHNRTLENWRRNRFEDANGEASINSGLSNNSTDGWRGVIGGSSNSSFGGNHRWSRSSSWRDEDISSGTNNDTYGSGSNYTMQRSYSTISTTVTDRGSGNTGGYLSSASIILKNNTQSNNNFGSSVNSGTGRNLNSTGNINAIMKCSGNGGGGNNSQWSQSTMSADADDNLPEWAMENPSDSGGTFDATGAFHGSSLDDDDSISITSKLESDKEIQSKHILGLETSSKYLPENEPENKNHEKSNEQDDNQDVAMKITTACDETMNVQNTNTSYSTSPYDDAEKACSPKVTSSKEDNNNPNLVSVTKTETIFKHNDKYVSSLSLSSGAGNNNYYENNLRHAPTPITTIENATTTTNTSAYTRNQTDDSDRMKIVADDMVQKLIMDDDIAASQVMLNENNTSPLPINNTVNNMKNILSGTANTFVSPAVNVLLKASISTQPQSVSAMSVSPTLKVMPLYGGDVVLDHASMQQHHHLSHQQQQITTATSGMSPSAHHSNSITATNTDLWYYRDPQSKVQGPFTAMEMTEWYRAGYFNENLYVRRVCDSRFRALGELIKLCHDNMPFTNLHLMPTINSLGLIDGIPPSTPKAATSTVQASTAPNIITQSSSTVLQLKNERSIHEELKGNVTAAANSISAAVKNLISSVDMSQMLNMHFQMLQEQHLQRQELLISTELSKNECFQRLPPPERDTIIRQKVQLLGLPEYLTSLNALSNSLATLNPRAGIQLYDAIAAAQQQQPQHHQPQQHTAQGSPANAPFMVDPEFLLNAHQQQPLGSTQFCTTAASIPPPPPIGSYISGDVVAGNAVSNNSTDLPSEYYLRMLLRGVGSTGDIVSHKSAITPSSQSALGISGNNDYLTETQMMPNSSLNPMMQMWLPHQQHLIQQHQPTQALQNGTTQNNTHGQWAGGPLVGIPNVVMSNVGVAMQPPIPSTWDAPNAGSAAGTAVTETIVQQQQQKPQNPAIDTLVQQQQQQPTTTTNELQIQQKQGLHTEIQNKKNTLQLQNPDVSVLINNNNNNFKQRKDEPKQSVHTEKQSQQSNGSNNKRNNKQQFNKQPSNRDEFNNNSSINQRKADDERSRDTTEDKRRQKEERRRQQAEEEKRRLQLAEEEKRRQMQEEKDRQQQIQAQRRKAMLGGNHYPPTSNTVAMNNGNSNSNTVSASSKSNQQRIQSSIAPWSMQTIAAAMGNNLGPPCLAEIQKAERRERRADQQRQMEMLERQMRATTSVENIDSLLKWNASVVSVPVKSFAEIQAEETKRLLTEQEIQRRKQHDLQEQHSSGFMTGNTNLNTGAMGHLNVAAVVAAGTANANPSNILAIWGNNNGGGTNNKVWSPSFWEEPVKFNTTSTDTAGTSTATIIVGSTAANSKSVQPQQQRSTSSLVQSGGNTTAPSFGAHARNLRKSQTVSVMQHMNGGAAAKNSNRSQQQNVAATGKHQQNPKIQQSQKGCQDSDKKTIVTVSGTDKKVHSNNNNSVGATSSSVYQKRNDDLENEFTMWCTKILNNMNTKVDVPTFVAFLQDLESPYEVKDYIRMYLGESKEFTDFSKQFLERRSKYKNLQRAQNAHNDDMCKPAPAITPSACTDNSDSKGKQKKIKKNKMTKLDARILGFSVTAAEGRINVGDRDYGDAS